MSPAERSLAQLIAIQKALNSVRYSEARTLVDHAIHDARRAVLQEKAENPAPRPLVEMVHL